MNWKEQLRQLKPCLSSDEIAALSDDPREAYESVYEGNHLVWLVAGVIEMQSAGHRRLVGVLCRMIRQVIYLVPRGERRPLQVLGLVERWTAGDDTVTTEMLQRAAYDAINATAKSYTRYDPNHAARAVANIVTFAQANADSAKSAHDTAIYVANAVHTAADDSDAMSARIADEIRAEFTFDEVWAMWERHFN